MVGHLFSGSEAIGKDDHTDAHLCESDPDLAVRLDLRKTLPISRNKTAAVDKYDSWKRVSSGQIQIQLLLVAAASGVWNVGNDMDFFRIADDEAAEEERGELEHTVETVEKSPEVDFDSPRLDRTRRQVLRTTSKWSDGFNRSLFTFENTSRIAAPWKSGYIDMNFQNSREVRFW